MKKHFVKTAALIMTGLMAGAGLSGCGSAAGNGNATGSDAENAKEREVAVSVEAESGEFAGNVKVETSVSGYSGEGYVSGFEKDGDSLTMSFDIKEEGFYDLEFNAFQSGGYKENYVFVDDEAVGNLAGENESFAINSIPHVYLTAGTHAVKVEKYWGWINVDRLDVVKGQEIDASIFEVTTELSNENASENAKRMYRYLSDNYGKNFISGQYCDEGIYGNEMAVIFKETGKLPAMVGLDMIEYSPSRVENGSSGTSIDRAIEAWDNNCLVTMCWHWNAPSKYLTGTWYSGFYKEHTNIDLDKIMSGEDEEGYDLLVSDMDVIAKELAKLKEADVPVLWRPLHEASGGWFWWGNCSADSYIKLYRLMYEKFVNEYELNNLIWVWNGQSKDWFPGDDVVDIIGIDVYPGEHVYTSQYPKFAECLEVTDTKRIVTMSENGCIFDPELAIRDGAMWSYIGTWSGEFITDGNALKVYSEQYTEADILKKFYTHENVITRDELPDLKTY